VFNVTPLSKKAIMKILCIGEALIDMICTDVGKSLVEGQNFLKKAGGAPANVAAAIAALGGKVDLAAKVGADPFGSHLIDVMQSFGVGTLYMVKDENYFTTLAFVSLMENGERDFYFNRGADGQLSRQEITEMDLTSFSTVHFGSATAVFNRPVTNCLSGIIAKVFTAQYFITFDPNYRHLLFKNNVQSFIDQSWNFLKSCHFFKVSDEEAMMITGNVTVEDAHIHY
jgi:fructokinase